MAEQLDMNHLTSPLAHVRRRSVAVDPSLADARGITFNVMDKQAIVQVFASKGQRDAVATKLGISAEAGTATVTDAYTALPLSPGQWILHTNRGVGARDGAFCAELHQQLHGIGHASEQSHGRLVIGVSGRHARQLMQKGCRLDLHPSVASAGFCAQTTMAQVGVVLHQSDDAPAYEIVLYSGFASSFWDWLTHSAAEFGYLSY